MMTVRCYLAPSSIEGLGVHSHEPIVKGQTIWRLDPRFDRLIPLADAEAAPEHFRSFIDRYAYEHPGHPGFLILDADEGRFMNHSDDPNTDYADPNVGVALRDIAPGEELTCDYRDFTVGEIVFQPSRHRVGALSHPLEADAA